MAKHTEGFRVAPKFENLNYILRNIQFPIGLKEMRGITSELSWSERNFYKRIVGMMESYYGAEVNIHYFGLAHSELIKTIFIVVTDSDVGLISTKGFMFVVNVDLFKIDNEKILGVEYEISTNPEPSLLNPGILYVEVDEGQGPTQKITFNNVLKDNIQILYDLIKDKAGH
jgi:hypothetical protein